jgi:hypothetical protein
LLFFLFLVYRIFPEVQENKSLYFLYPRRKKGTDCAVKPKVCNKKEDACTGKRGFIRIWKTRNSSLIILPERFMKKVGRIKLFSAPLKSNRPFYGGESTRNRRPSPKKNGGGGDYPPLLLPERQAGRKRKAAFPADAAS